MVTDWIVEKNTSYIFFYGTRFLTLFFLGNYMAKEKNSSLFITNTYSLSVLYKHEFLLVSRNHVASKAVISVRTATFVRNINVN